MKPKPIPVSVKPVKPEKPKPSTTKSAKCLDDLAQEASGIVPKDSVMNLTHTIHPDITNISDTAFKLLDGILPLRG